METRTRLAFDRTFLAQERTQLAWVRTGLGLITFGFGIAQFFRFLHQQQDIVPPVFGAYGVGMTMIAIGLVSLALATLQHRRALKLLRAECPELPRSVAGATAGVIMVLGLLAFVGAILRH